LPRAPRSIDVRRACRRAAAIGFVQQADVVIIGSGGTLAVVDDALFVSQLRLDPRRQLIGSQCSGALVLARLGLLAGSPACTDATYRPRLEAAGVRVLDQPFFARGDIATAGGCMSAAHLSAWVLWRLLGAETAALILDTVAPVGKGSQFTTPILRSIAPYIPRHHAEAAE
jgi:transcriptional regulator GlxA family with amidase domain